MKRLFYLLIMVLALSIGFSSCSIPGNNSNYSPTSTDTRVATTGETATPSLTGETATPSSTPTTPATPGAAEVSQVVTMYYDALKAQNYSAAYTYLDANATDANGQKITQKSFEQMAQTMESEGGPVISFSVAIFPPAVVMSVTRKLLVYHAHLQVKQENQTWKITSLDRT